MCLNEYLLSDDGDGQIDDMRWTDETNPMDRRIKGFKSRVSIVKIEEAKEQGVPYLMDIRFIENNYGLPNTFSFE